MQRSRRQTRVRMHLVPAQAMSLYRYFKPTLSSPSGPLAESINPATIKAANEAVKDATSKPSKARGTCTCSYHVRIIRIIYPLYIRACARACARARALRHRVPVSDRNFKIRNFFLKIFSTFSEFLAAENYPLYGIPAFLGSSSGDRDDSQTMPYSLP